MTGPEGARRTFSVHIEQAPSPFDLVPFRLARIMRHVEQRFDPCLRKKMPECAPRQMCENLAVGERHVDGGVHRAEVLLALGRMDRRAGEFAVRKFQSEALCGLGKAHEVIGADLVPQAARSAVDRYDRLPLREAEGQRGLLVVDALDGLHFEVMVARTERTHLAALTLL